MNDQEFQEKLGDLKDAALEKSASRTLLTAAILSLPFGALIVVAMLLGGITNPVYALLIATSWLGVVKPA